MKVEDFANDIIELARENDVNPATLTESVIVILMSIVKQTGVNIALDDGESVYLTVTNKTTESE